MSSPFSSTSNLISTPSLTTGSTTPSSHSSSSSTSSPYTRAPPQKDYFSALYALSSTYGTNGSAPTPVPRQADSDSLARMKARSLPHRPTKTQKSVQSEKHYGNAKDYQTAFGALQVHYGLASGALPTADRQVQTRGL